MTTNHHHHQIAGRAFSHLRLAVFFATITLGGVGIGVLTADFHPDGRVSSATPKPSTTTTTVDDPTTTTTAQPVTTTTAKPRAARSEVKPLPLVTTTTAKPEIGTATSIVRKEPELSNSGPMTALQVLGQRRR